jgi:hypothetical protein
MLLLAYGFHRGSRVVYILTLPAEELANNWAKLLAENRITKAIPKSALRVVDVTRPRMAVVLGTGNDKIRHLRWLGVVARYGTVGAVDESITIDPLKPCPSEVRIDGPTGLLSEFTEDERTAFDRATADGAAGICGESVWHAIERILRARHPELAGLLDWLTALANPPEFSPEDAADRSWQEQKDCADCLVRIFGLPLLSLAAWQRPGSRDLPYLSGIVPQPYEQAMIDNDTRATFRAYPLLFEGWREAANRDIQVLRDAHGRQLEIVNVNNTPVEGRTGTDMIYYYQPTESFILVQYKRLESKNDEFRADDQFYGQLDRLEKIAVLSRPPGKPSEWRLGTDPCYLKLAYWPQRGTGNSATELTPGMYLPLSYVRLLLADEATRGPGKPYSTARLLSYNRVERHLVGSQFTELVVHGLIGTVGVTRDMLTSIVSQRLADGHSVMLGVEHSRESGKQRANRVRNRGAKRRSYLHEVTQSSNSE